MSLIFFSLVTPSGITSVPVGVETPDMIELRKRRIEDSMDQGGETPALYQVLPEKRTAVGGAMMGSAHIYDVAGVGPCLSLSSSQSAQKLYHAFYYRGDIEYTRIVPTFHKLLQ